MIERLKQSWKVVIGVLPAYGAYNSSQQFGEPWSGLIAGLIIAGLLLGVVKLFTWARSRLAK